MDLRHIQVIEHLQLADSGRARHVEPAFIECRELHVPRVVLWKGLQVESIRNRRPRQEPAPPPEGGAVAVAEPRANLDEDVAVGSDSEPGFASDEIDADAERDEMHHGIMAALTNLELLDHCEEGGGSDSEAESKVLSHDGPIGDSDAEPPSPNGLVVVDAPADPMDGIRWFPALEGGVVLRGDTPIGTLSAWDNNISVQCAVAGCGRFIRTKKVGQLNLVRWLAEGKDLPPDASPDMRREHIAHHAAIEKPSYAKMTAEAKAAALPPEPPVAKAAAPGAAASSFLSMSVPCALVCTIVLSVVSLHTFRSSLLPGAFAFDPQSHHTYSSSNGQTIRSRVPSEPSQCQPSSLGYAALSIGRQPCLVCRQIVIMRIGNVYCIASIA